MQSLNVEDSPSDTDLTRSELVPEPKLSLDSEASFRYLFAINPLPMWIYDLQTLVFLEVNDTAAATYGYTHDEFLKMRLTDIQPLEDGSYTPDDLAQGHLPRQISGQWQHRLKNGRLVDVEITSYTLTWAGRAAALVIAQDITERKQTEEALQDSIQKLKIAYEQTTIYARELNLKITELKQAETSLRHKADDLAVLYEASQVFLSQNDVETTLQTACQLVVERLNLQMSWVGLISKDDVDVHPVAAYSVDRSDYLHTLQLNWAANPSGQGSMSQAIRTAQAVATNRLETGPTSEPWWQAVLAGGFRSTAALPLIYDQQVLGVLNVYSVDYDHFTADRLQTLQSFANLLAVALAKARLFEQVHTARERLQLLSQQLVDAQEAERRHIARELHDEIGQTLTAVKINLQAMQRLFDASSLTTALADSIDIVEQAIQQVRNLSLDLRPSMLDDLGLVATLRWYLDRQAKWAGFTAQLTANPLDMQLPSNLETVCFRLVQEALTNVLRHAQAQWVQVDLQLRETDLQLRIRDDGLGFEMETILERVAHGTGLGLLGMQERVTLLGGRLDIHSSLGRGTEIRVYLPIPLSSSSDE
ncbi:MAG: GAF domain-containing protein, partial [Chloroflexi bacterium]|nr:GAF domain-containing protein [Chloroflexota bacterium]